jgi:hypothetical protein
LTTSLLYNETTKETKKINDIDKNIMKPPAVGFDAESLENELNMLAMNKPIKLITITLCLEHWYLPSAETPSNI